MLHPQTLFVEYPSDYFLNWLKDIPHMEYIGGYRGTNYIFTCEEDYLRAKEIIDFDRK